ncbi:GNAT family N-acetyltransferase [Phenylobacterium sp.]|uniref:GNAT family N-acetyltransferase n=1 Tax=Phenylobacterium sp. TaxID=1871053 RepID=UPI0025D08100|nr:GNAT family N-acetyltransferase [Phenylobacterium sp.]
MAAVELRKASLDGLPQYVDALKRGWSPDNVRGRLGADEQLARIAEDAAAFVASQDDPEGRGAPIILPDGTKVVRLPGYYRWIWDGQFCGTVGFRWQPGTPDLPPHVLGHIGYGVVPWRQGRGYATAALALALPDARARGLPYVELTTDPDNVASQRVIEANGGVLVDRFRKPAAYGEAEGLRYRIAL